MNFDDPLVPVFEAFDVARKCFEVTAHLVVTRQTELVDSPLFNRASVGYVIEYLQTANRLLAAGYPKQYSTRLAEKFTSEVEYWRFAQVLDLFKGEIDANLIGEVKQVKQYRDWIAHRNPGNRMSTAFTPETAFNILSRMIRQIRLTHTLSVTEKRIDAPALAPVS